MPNNRAGQHWHCKKWIGASSLYGCVFSTHVTFASSNHIHWVHPWVHSIGSQLLVCCSGLLSNSPIKNCVDFFVILRFWCYFQSYRSLKHVSTPDWCSHYTIKPNRTMLALQVEVGQLSTIRIGLDQFSSVCFHTTRWNWAKLCWYGKNCLCEHGISYQSLDSTYIYIMYEGHCHSIQNKQDVFLNATIWIVKSLTNTNCCFSTQSSVLVVLK